MEFCLETPNFRAIEKITHDEFPNNHEWVKADLSEIKKIINYYDSNSKECQKRFEKIEEVQTNKQ